MRRSRPLTSLYFFRSLRLINNTDSGRQVAIFINDNVNLQYLFDWGEGSKTTSLALGPGSKEASFFYNPRLCPEEVSRSWFKRDCSSVLFYCPYIEAVVASG